MMGLGRVVMASCLTWSMGCGQSTAADPNVTGGGAAGVMNGDAGTSASGTSSAGSAVTSVAGTSAAGSAGKAIETGGASGAVQANAAGDSGAPAADGSAGADGGFESSDVGAILATYRSFAAQTPAPVSVSAYIFALCRNPTLRETEFKASIHGDGRYLQDFANPLAVQGLASRGVPSFPVGAVIVKEKYAGPQTAQADLVAIGLMIKREAGFDSARGDWDYAYYEPALGIIQTAEQSAYCANCHAGAAATDFVFVDGLKP